MLPLWPGVSESPSFERSARFLLSNGQLPSSTREGAATVPATGEESFFTAQAMGAGRLLWIPLGCFRWMVAYRAANSLMGRQDTAGADGAASRSWEGGWEGGGFWLR